MCQFFACTNVEAMGSRDLGISKHSLDQEHDNESDSYMNFLSDEKRVRNLCRKPAANSRMHFRPHENGFTRFIHYLYFKHLADNMDRIQQRM